MFRKVNDFDGDGRADYAITRKTNGLLIWYIWHSTDGFRAYHWGNSSPDQPAAGDYDGDGKTDLAIYREIPNAGNFQPTYTFHIFRSQTGTYVTTTFNYIMWNFNAPLHQDYDGDGKTDPAAYFGEFGMIIPMRIHLSTTNFQTQLSVPSSHGVARIGDIDGDQHADIAFLNSGILKLSNYDSSNPRNIDISNLNGFLVPADFDGDGKGEIAVWRNADGNWLWIRSSDGVFQNVHFGSPGDTPVPADYDGDGKTDLAIWRPGNQSYYWVYGSQSGLSVLAWGIAGDSPVRY